MPSQHRWQQRSIRPDPAVWDRAKSYATRTGQALTAVVTKALTEYLDRHDTKTEPEEQQ